MTKMLGSDAILRSLEAEGVEVMFGIPGGAILPNLRRDRARHERPPCSRAPRTGRRPHGRGLRARVRQGRRRDGDLRPGCDEPRHPDRRRVDGLDAARLHHRTGEVEPDRHRRLPGDRRDRSRCRIVKHSWLVQDVRELPQVMKKRIPRCAHRPPGPVLVDIAKDVQEAEFDFVYPDEVGHARLEAATKGARAADPRGGERRSPSRASRSSTQAAACSNAEASSELARAQSKRVACPPS